MIGLILALALSVSSAFAETSKKDVDPVYRPVIHAKRQIEVVGYDAAKKLFHITWHRIPAEQSRLYATPANLAKAVRSLSLTELQKKPTSIIGNVYSTDEALDLTILPAKKTK